VLGMVVWLWGMVRGARWDMGKLKMGCMIGIRGRGVLRCRSWLVGMLGFSAVELGVWKRRGEGDDFKVAFRLSYMIFQEPSLIVKSRCRERIGRTNRYMVTENLRL
jgi:hypothetical protein